MVLTCTRLLAVPCGLHRLTCVLCSHPANLLGSLDRLGVEARPECHMILSLGVHFPILRKHVLKLSCPGLRPHDCVLVY